MAVEFPVNANTKGAEKNINNLIESFRKLGKAAGLTDNEIDDITVSVKKMGTEGVNSVSKINQSMGGLNGTVKRVQNTVVSLFAADKLIQFGNHLIKITSDFQKYEALLKNTFGSRSAAFTAFVNIQQQAAKTNFSLNEVTQGYLKLANNGIAPTNAELTSFFDLTNNAGKGFDMFVEAVNDAVNGEFERLKEFFIKGSKDGDKVTLMFKSQKFTVDNNAESIKNLLVQLGQLNGVAGSTAAIAGTLEGKMSNFGDNMDQLVKSLGNRSSGVIGGFFDFANDALGALNESLNDNVVALQKEQATLNILVGAITDVNTSEEARKRLIEELNREYPDFLRNLDAEKITNEQLKSRLADVNEQFVRKITLVAAEKRLLETQEEILDSIDEENKLRKHLEAIKRGAIDTQIQANATMTFAEMKQALLAATEQKINTILSNRKSLQEDVTEKLNEYQKTLGVFNEEENDYFEITKKSTTATNEKTKAAFDLKEALKKINDELRRMKHEEEVIESVKDQLLKKPIAKFIADSYKHAEKVMKDFTDKFAADQEKQKEIELKRIEEVQEAKDYAREVELDAINSIFDSRSASIEREMAMVEASRQHELDNAGENAEAKAAINKKFDERQRQLANKQASLQQQQALFNIVVNQGPAIAKTIGTLGFPAALPFLVALGVLFTSLMSKQRSTAVPKYRDGVFDVQGDGTGTSDSIDARLSAGESVTPHEVTSKFGAALKPMIENEFFEWVDLKKIVDMKVPSRQYAAVVVGSSSSDNERLLSKISDQLNDIKNKSETHINIDEDGFHKWNQKGDKWVELVNRRYSKN